MCHILVIYWAAVLSYFAESYHLHEWRHTACLVKLILVFAFFAPLAGLAGLPLPQLISPLPLQCDT